MHKLFLGGFGRYSEDIDLVQRDAGPIGHLADALRKALDPWLGKPKWKQGHGRFTLIYRFETSFAPVSTMRLKIEINTREHFSVYEITKRNFRVDNPWFSGEVDLPVYQLDELLGTKLRALYQRKKGRDLFDLWLALQSGEVDRARVIECFQSYLLHDGVVVSRAEFEANLALKLGDQAFIEDIRPLIPADVDYDPLVAVEIIQKELIAKLPGDPWKGTQEQ